MQDQKEKSIVLIELEQNDYCEIEQKNGRLYLNNKDITSIRLELFKILKQSILSLQKSLEFQKNNLQRFFGKFIIEPITIRSNQDSITQPQTQINYYDFDNNSDNGDNDNDQDNDDNSECQQRTIIPEELIEVSEKTIIDQSFENILIDQYFSIILLINSQISDNPQTILLQETQSPPVEEERINQNKIQTEKEKNDRITFLSPFHKRHNSVQIFDIEEGCNQCFQKQASTHYCKWCEFNFSSMNQKNEFLMKIKKVFIFDTLFAQLGKKIYCEHKQDKQNFEDSNYETEQFYEFQDLSNFKYRSLFLDCFRICDLLSQNNLLINISQMEYLKEIIIEIDLLPYINIKQKQNQFLQSLKFNTYYSSNITFSQIQECLDNINFSEIKIHVYSNYHGEVIEELKVSELLNYDSLIYVSDKRQKLEGEEEELIEIINERYKNKLCLFTFHKLFKDEFSIFRLTYDLYDQD